jgi:hypothetical protein
MQADLASWLEPTFYVALGVAVAAHLFRAILLRVLN